MGRLADDRNLWLATARPDGRPHLVPVWFVFVGGSFWVGTGARSVKVANVRRSGLATVALEDGNAPVAAECAAREVARPFPAEVVTAFRDKYSWDLDVDVDEDLGEVALLELTPDRWLFGGPAS
ncbi:MAG: pyridoxamine 5'-phosphate oxidase family protein [Microthrixaceae bacterium]